jgi:hypothetical protein
MTSAARAGTRALFGVVFGPWRPRLAEYKRPLTVGRPRPKNISNRTALPKWKKGDVAACRECVGYRVSFIYQVCVHTTMVTPEAAAKEHGRCWKCPSRCGCGRVPCVGR